jgi:hypothetical protein
MNAMNYIAKMKYGKLSRDPYLFVRISFIKMLTEVELIIWLIRKILS